MRWPSVEILGMTVSSDISNRQRKDHPLPVGNRAITFCFGKVITCNGMRPSGSNSKSSYNCKAYNATTNSWDDAGAMDSFGGIDMRR